MCVLIEMLTAKMPWCFYQDLEQQRIIMMVKLTIGECWLEWLNFTCVNLVANVY